MTHSIALKKQHWHDFKKGIPITVIQNGLLSKYILHIYCINPQFIYTMYWQ